MIMINLFAILVSSFAAGAMSTSNRPGLLVLNLSLAIFNSLLLLGNAGVLK